MLRYRNHTHQPLNRHTARKQLTKAGRVLSDNLCILIFFSPSAPHTSFNIPQMYIIHKIQFYHRGLLQHAFDISRSSVINSELILFPVKTKILNLAPFKYSTTFQLLSATMGQICNSLLKKLVLFSQDPQKILTEYTIDSKNGKRRKI